MSEKKLDCIMIEMVPPSRNILCKFPMYFPKYSQNLYFHHICLQSKTHNRLDNHLHLSCSEWDFPHLIMYVSWLSGKEGHNYLLHILWHVSCSIFITSCDVTYTDSYSQLIYYHIVPNIRSEYGFNFDGYSAPEEKNCPNNFT